MTDEITPLDKKEHICRNREYGKAHINYDKEDVKQNLTGFIKELKDIEIWECSPDEYLDRLNQLKTKHFGELADEL